MGPSGVPQAPDDDQPHCFLLGEVTFDGDDADLESEDLDSAFFSACLAS